MVFLDVPHIALVSRATPKVLTAIFPAIKNRFVLALVIGAPQRESVLGPDDKG